MFVRELGELPAHDPRLEERALRHILMQRELRRQREDMDLLLACPALDRSSLAGLATRCRHPALSNLESESQRAATPYD